MECQYCKKTFNNLDSKPILLLPCCDKVCLNCFSQTYQKCIKCNQLVRSRRSISFSRNDFQSNEKIYQNKYKEICYLDSGSFGCVYIVQSIQDKEIYALKAMQYNLLQKFSISSEIALLMKLKHEFIINYFDAFHEGILYCIVTEYCEGGNLETKIRETIISRLTFKNETIFTWITELLDAVSYLHSKRVIHRDIKPENIFICFDNHLKIGDFGVAANIDRSTLFSTVAGTFHFMSPEIKSGLKYNYKTDVWSLGCILFELIKLEKYFYYYNKYNLEKHSKNYDIFTHLNTLDIFKLLLKKMLIVEFQKRSSSIDLFHLVSSYNLENESENNLKNNDHDDFESFISGLVAINKSSNDFKMFIKESLPLIKNESTYNFDSKIKKPVCSKLKFEIFLILLLITIVNVILLGFKTSNSILPVNNSIRTLRGHTDAVTSLCVLPNNTLASGSQDSTILLWNTSTYTLIRRLEGHKNRVRSIVYLKKLDLIASGSDDHNVILWNYKHGTIFRILKQTREVFSIFNAPDNKLIISSWDLTISVYDLNNLTRVQVKENAHLRGINSIMVLADKYLVSSSHQDLKIWDVTNINELYQKSTTIPVESLVEVSPNLFASGSDPVIEIWNIKKDLRTNRINITLAKKLIKHQAKVTSLILFKHGLLLSGSDDKTINIWNITDGSLKKTLYDHSKAVKALAVLDNGFLVSASDDETIKIRTNDYWKDFEFFS